MSTAVTTYYLEMSAPSALLPSRRQPQGLVITQATLPSPPLNRYLYTAVGGDFHWCDRLAWRYSDWMEWLDRPEVQTWIGSYWGTPAGYFELELQDDRSVEIVYFGLIGQFVGAGLGGPLLTCAVEQAWEMGANRVWVHTCTLDHPNALANYQARGFQLYKSEIELVTLSETPGLWPGA